MKTINKRVEDLEENNATKPILVLWGDWNDADICRVGDDGPVLAWEEAEERFGENNILIRVKYVDDWRP